MKNTQAVNDFIMSRTLEKNELVKMIGGQNFGSLGNQNPYAPSSQPGYPSGGYGMPPSQPGYQGYPGYPPRPNYPPY